MASAQAYLPQASGGAQSSTHELSVELIQRGHEVAVISSLAGNGWLGVRDRVLLKIGGRRAVRDDIMGYPAYRAWAASTAAKEVVRRVQPDVAVVPTFKGVPLAAALLEAGVPVVIYLRDVEFHELGGELADLRGVRFLANSGFTARRYREQYGVNATVVPPFFKADLYKTSTSGRYVTFVNPHRNKGVEIALQLAERCPDIPFCFVEGWKLPEADDRWLRQRLKEVPNVSVKPRTPRMAEIYAETKILLAPSQWEEAWGRVVSEAHFSGIPTLATRIGGLPESVGLGGVLIERDAPIEAWVNELRRLWDDPQAYKRASAAAIQYSLRDEIDRDKQVNGVLGVLEEAVVARAGLN